MQQRHIRTFPHMQPHTQTQALTNSFSHTPSQVHPPAVSLSRTLITNHTHTHCAKSTLLHKGWCSNILTRMSGHKMKSVCLTKHVCMCKKESPRERLQGSFNSADRNILQAVTDFAGRDFLPSLPFSRSLSALCFVSGVNEPSELHTKS